MAIDEKLAQKLEAIPVHSPRQYTRQPLDPRLARKFLRTKSISPMEAERLFQYVITSRWRPDERAVYASIADGFTTEAEITTVTGLSVHRTQSAITNLKRKGYIKVAS